MTAKRIEGKPFIVADSIGEILSEAGIVMGRARLSPGRDVKVICPACNGGSTKEQSLSIKLDADGQGAAWHCKRGKCGGSSIVPGSGRIASGDRDGSGPRQDEAPARRERAPVIIPRLDPPDAQGKPPELYAYFARRGISQETVDAFGIYSTKRRWRALDAAGKEIRDGEGQASYEAKPTIVYPYAWGGVTVNRKFRSRDKQFQQDKDAERTLYNIDAFTSPDEGIFCEGENDVLAMYEAGFRQVTSLPDGSPSKLLDEDDPKRQDDMRYDALEVCAEQVADLQRVILATDGDVPGGYHAEELARRLGKTRCWRVTWPEGCKDANETLLRHMPPEERGKREPTEDEKAAGIADIQAAIAGAEAWPLMGLFPMRPGTLRAFLTAGKTPTGLASGIKALDEVVKLPAGGGWLTVVTGIPSHGKSSFLRGWLPYIAMKHDVGIVWCSPEDNTPEVIALDLAQILKGQPVKEAGTYMPEALLREAEDWMRQRVTFLYADDPDIEMTMDWVLARAQEAKKRHKRQLLVVDPWNEVEHQVAKGESETQYTGRWLRRIKAWGRREGMGVLIAAHPKMQVLDPKTKRFPVVGGYDINGSAMWFNRADVGLTIYRQFDGYVDVNCWKARFPAFGTRNSKATLKRDPRTGRLASCGNDTGQDQATAEQEIGA